MKARIVSSAFLVLIFAASAVSQNVSPAETVRAFYKFSNAHSPVFNRRHIELRKRWYSPALYRLFLDELRKEKDFLKQHPTEKPFFGDGLDFRPLDETCEAKGKHYRRSQSISATHIKGTQAYVDVKFAYPQVCREAPIFYRVQLEKLGGKWLIQDWTYSSGMTRDPGNEREQILNWSVGLRRRRAGNHCIGIVRCLHFTVV